VANDIQDLEKIARRGDPSHLGDLRDDWSDENSIDSPAAEVLTVPELAEFLRVHPTTIYRLLRAGKIQTVQGGRGNPGAVSARPLATIVRPLSPRRFKIWMNC